MPELAEVETVRRALKKNILNKKIKDIKIIYSKIIENDVDDFVKRLINKEFINLDRKGKYLIFETKDNFLISHLRMEGKYFIKNITNDITKHEHIIFIFEDDTTLCYHDTRKFGRMQLINKDEISTYFSKLGKEPNEVSLTYLKPKLSRSKKNIKTLLLDQSIIAGLGNIYANEVLFRAKVNPYKKGADLNDNEIENIIVASSSIIKKAIEEGGSTIKSYTSSLGVIGNYQNYLRVHGKENEKCVNCDEKIIKEKLDGRSSYYCKNCQK